MAVILRYFSEFGYLPGVLRKSSRSLSHLLMTSCIQRWEVREGVPGGSYESNEPAWIRHCILTWPRQEEFAAVFDRSWCLSYKRNQTLAATHVQIKLRWMHSSVISCIDVIKDDVVQSNQLCTLKGTRNEWNFHTVVMYVITNCIKLYYRTKQGNNTGVILLLFIVLVYFVVFFISSFCKYGSLSEVNRLAEYFGSREMETNFCEIAAWLTYAQRRSVSIDTMLYANLNTNTK